MKIIFYSKDAQFELTNEEFVSALNSFDSGHRVYIKRLEVSLSPLYIWAGEKPINKIQLHDGGWAIEKYGQWVLENDTSIKVDPTYYPELKKQQNNLLK